MHKILILNAKGGCGKTTVATNLAGYYASRGKTVTLADFDLQGSSCDWLSVRPEWALPIHGIEAWHMPVRVPKDTEYLILDAPAGLHGRELSDMLRRCDTVVIPMLPSPLDIRAGSRFIEELKSVRKVQNHDVRITTIANRVRENTLAAWKLNDYLSQQKLPDGRKMPFLTLLRGNRNYLRASECGLSLFEMAPATTEVDRITWKPLLRWLNSARSRPNP